MPRSSPRKPGKAAAAPADSSIKRRSSRSMPEAPVSTLRTRSTNRRSKVNEKKKATKPEEPVVSPRRIQAGAKGKKKSKSPVKTAAEPKKDIPRKMVMVKEAKKRKLQRQSPDLGLVDSSSSSGSTMEAPNANSTLTNEAQLNDDSRSIENIPRADHEPIVDCLQKDVTSNYLFDVTKRGKPKLFHISGHSYVVKRRLGKTVHWQCSVRPSGNRCPAEVIEHGGTYKKSEHIHDHEPKVRTTNRCQQKVHPSEPKTLDSAADIKYCDKSSLKVKVKLETDPFFHGSKCKLKKEDSDFKPDLKNLLYSQGSYEVKNILHNFGQLLESIENTSQPDLCQKIILKDAQKMIAEVLATIFDLDAMADIGMSGQLLPPQWWEKLKIISDRFRGPRGTENIDAIPSTGEAIQIGAENQEELVEEDGLGGGNQEEYQNMDVHIHPEEPEVCHPEEELEGGLNRIGSTLDFENPLNGLETTYIITDVDTINAMNLDGSFDMFVQGVPCEQVDGIPIFQFRHSPSFIAASSTVAYE